MDAWAAVGAEVAAALRVSLGKAGSFMAYGLAMSRLPAVAAVFAAGDIDLMLFTTIVYRTGVDYRPCGPGRRRQSAGTAGCPVAVDDPREADGRDRPGDQDPRPGCGTPDSGTGPGS